MSCAYPIPFHFSAFDHVFDVIAGDMTEIKCENSSVSKGTATSACLYQILKIAS